MEDDDGWDCTTSPEGERSEIRGHHHSSCQHQVLEWIVAHHRGMTIDNHIIN